MKKIIKKVASILAVMAVCMFAANMAHAADAYWNNHPRDLGFIKSKIFLDPSNPGNYSDNVTGAQPGQVIAVRLYYHNTGTGPANNTTFTMTQPSGTSTSHVISGTLRADGTNTDSGSTTINLTSAQTLTYIPGSLRFYRYNQYTTATPVSNDTSIFSGGLNVGSIPGMDSCPPTNDFCEQGVVAVAFRVGNTTQATYACNDGYDNDGDGRVDYPNDAGCSSYTDNDEYNYTQNTYVCSDNLDNDGDGRIDANDPGCYTNGQYDPYKNSEYNTVQSLYQCNDGYDNDGDGRVDYPNDAGCSSYTDNDEYNQVTFTPTVTTLNPTSLTTSSAQINGSVVNNGQTATVYFNWGTNSANLVNRTVSQTVTTNGTATFFDTLRGLATNTTYYYSAVMQDATGTRTGDVKSFRLVSGTVNPPVVVISNPPVVSNPVPTVASATNDRGVVLGLGTNLVQLRYVNVNQFNTLNNGFTAGQINTNNGVQNVCVDDSATFTVEYRNISNIVLTNAILHIDIPKDVDFRSSSAGTFNKADNTITINVGTLNPDQQGSVTFSGVVLESASNRDLLVVPATLSFETPNNGARETAIAYGLATTQNCVRNSNLGGFAFGSGFFPTTLIGWLLLILILAAIVYLVRRYYLLAPVTRTRKAKYYEDMDVPTAPYSHH